MAAISSFTVSMTITSISEPWPCRVRKDRQQPHLLCEIGSCSCERASEATNNLTARYVCLTFAVATTTSVNLSDAASNTRHLNILLLWPQHMIVWYGNVCRTT